MANPNSNAEQGRDEHDEPPQPKQYSRKQPGGAYFPLSYKEAVSQWWTSMSPAAAEHRVLSFIPYLQSPPTQMQSSTTPSAPKGSATDSAPASVSVSRNNSQTALGAGIEQVTTETSDDPFGPRRWHSHLVKLAGKDRALNEFSVERVGEDVEENLVMLHGYGAGLGFFYKNFEGLSQAKGWKVWALDLLGMGRSTRPPFRIHAKDPKGKISEAEDWFIDALEEWRIERKIEKFTLLGHSLGGYMATCYALKYPGRLHKLILASPAGVPEDPWAVNADMPDPADSKMQNEVFQDQEQIATSSNPDIPSSAKHGQTQSSGEAEKATPPRRPIPRWLSYLWDANVSPFGFVRWAGPFGPRLVSGWTSRRFAHLPADESQALHDYTYSLFRQRGSGEYVLAYVLAPGAFARNPLVNRIGVVGRKQLPPDVSHNNPAVKKETGLPIVLMYGEHDWMDVNGGYASKEKLDEARKEALKTASEEEKKAESGSAKVVVIPKAGHHVYLDNWKEFNSVIKKEMEGTLKANKALQAKF